MKISLTMKRILAGVLCTMLVAGPVCAQGPAAGSAPDRAKLKRLALSIPTGSAVRLEMKDKSKVSGKIGPVDNDGFDLQTVEGDNIVSKRVGFDQISKLSAGAPQSKMKTAAGRLLTAMSLLGTAAALTAAIRK